MDTAASRYNKGFTDEDEDDDDFGKRDGSSQKELNVRLDGKNSTDQRPSTPRSKHSATEQRRRSKINDRFQILRDLIPQSDQKRDKASFLLEVIEYVQFLQEKVQRYESAYSGWNQDTAKLMPWKKPQGTVEATVDPFHVIKNGNVPLAPVFSGEDTVPPAPVILAGDQTLLEDNVSSGLTNQAAAFSTPVQPYMAGSAGGGDMLNEQELTIDEGTISISTAYSQGLLQALTQALHNSGIDLSQSSISVQINLGKKAFNRPASNMKDMEDPSSANQAIGDSRVGSSGEEQEQPKRHKKS